LLTQPQRQAALLPLLTSGQHQPRGPPPVRPAHAPASAASLLWARARTPTLQSLEQLRPFLPPADAPAVLDPPAPLTALEAQDCTEFPAELRDLSIDLDQAASLFDEVLLPSAQHHRTRAAYYAAWRSFVSFAYLHNALDRVLPATTALLKAYVWNLLQLDYKPGTITVHLCAVLDRHRRHLKAFPVTPSQFRHWIQAYTRVVGCPRRDKMPINAAILKAILRLPRVTLRDLRDAAIVALGTVCAMRVRELCEIDVCDALFSHDAPGVLTIRVKVRKNDSGRGGLWPRCGSASDPRHDIPSLLREWMRRADLHRHAMCTKATYPRSTCHACGRLFSRLQGNGQAIFPVGHAWHGTTHTTITEALRSVLTRANIDTTGFSGISMRAGGLTTALAANVPADLFTMQSGHASDAWKHYVRGHSAMLLRFYDAFEL
jgi:integrase